MTVIFDGKTFAKQKVEVVRGNVNGLRKKGIRPKLVSILIGNNPASRLYVNLKKKTGQEIGVEVDAKALKPELGKEEIIKNIKVLNNDKSVHGIMIQLPLPKAFSLADRDEIISSIVKVKDVDGLKEDSLFLTPVVKAVVEILREASGFFPSDRPAKIVVIGADGFEGRKILKILREMDYGVEGVDKNTTDLKTKTKGADVLISVTGSPGIIGKEDIKDGAVVIDVGSPKGDVQKEDVIGKAAFLSPVPGGVGPVTISCLLENLVEAAGK